MTDNTTLEEIFRFDDDGPRWPAVRPKDAASLVLVKRERKTVRVLMAERHSSHVFLPGRFVFPGGRLEAGDLRLVIPSDLRPEVRAKVAAGTGLAKARGLALAAVRETFEETGLMVGARVPPSGRTRSPGWARFFARGIVPKLERLEFIARAVTPPGRPRRFDARFFMADAEDIAGSVDTKETTGELLNPVWLTLKEAREARVLPITRCVLSEVEARLTGGGGGRPVPFYLLRHGRPVILSL
jgi:8-oxo-dGTP pyrophosphatase MutT (NUDIX family)